MHRLHVRGTPREMGLAHGEALRGPIRELADIRYALVCRRMPGWSTRDIDALALRQVAALARRPGPFAEFEGIADASGLAPHALMILNNYTDLRDFDSGDEGCSTFSIRGRGRDVCGQTWDMHASARPYVLHLSRGGDTPCEVLTLAGCLALAGVNGHNLGVFINNLNCRQTGDGLMWPALVQEVLAHRAARSAARFIQDHLPCSGRNYLLCGNDTVINAETTAVDMDVTFDARNGTVFHTNHYLGRLQRHERTDRRSATSIPRHEALQRFFARHDDATINLALVAEKLCSSSADDSICVPYTGADASATCGGILYDRVERRGIVFAGTFDRHDHSPFHFPAA